jgi:HPt (histidine-containing phosphotransfer) domain-containing protein
MSETQPSGQPVRSTLATDPEMQELIEFFVNEIPNRVDAMQTAWQEEDATSLERIVHQLKGAGGGYGFQTISDAATAVEKPLKDGINDLEALSAEFDQLVNLCNRVIC